MILLKCLKGVPDLGVLCICLFPRMRTGDSSMEVLLFYSKHSDEIQPNAERKDATVRSMPYDHSSKAFGEIWIKMHRSYFCNLVHALHYILFVSRLIYWSKDLHRSLCYLTFTISRIFLTFWPQPNKGLFWAGPTRWAKGGGAGQKKLTWVQTVPTCFCCQRM